MIITIPLFAIIIEFICNASFLIKLPSEGYKLARYFK